jgi:hypothetical protein
VEIGTATNLESAGTCNPSGAAQYGWPMTETSNTAIGLPATIALPLSY